MKANPDKVLMPTRRADPALAELLKSLTPGDKIVVTQTVRVGAKTWPAEVAGAYRGVDYLCTGTTTDRVPEDDIIVPMLHFVKANGEMSSVSLDEHTRLRRG